MPIPGPIVPFGSLQDLLVVVVRFLSDSFSKHVTMFDPKSYHWPFFLRYIQWRFWESERYSVTHENSSRQTDSRDLCKAAVEDPAFSAARATELSGQSECVASVGSLLKEYRCTMLHHVAPCCTVLHVFSTCDWWWFVLFVGQSSVTRPNLKAQTSGRGAFNGWS